MSEPKNPELPTTIESLRSYLKPIETGLVKLNEHKTKRYTEDFYRNYWTIFANFVATSKGTLTADGKLGNDKASKGLKLEFFQAIYPSIPSDRDAYKNDCLFNELNALHRKAKDTVHPPVEKKAEKADTETAGEAESEAEEKTEIDNSEYRFLKLLAVQLLKQDKALFCTLTERIKNTEFSQTQKLASATMAKIQAYAEKSYACDAPKA